MKFYRLALIFLSSVIYGSVNAQSFAELDNFRGRNAFTENEFEVMIRRTQVHTPRSLNYGGTTFNFQARFDYYEKGDQRWHFENSTLGDMLWVLANQLKGKDPLGTDAQQAYGSGFFGWHQVCWNVVAKDRTLVSPGISFGDYIFSTKPAGQEALNPQGYYFNIGPALMLTQVVGNDFWVNATLRYDITGRATRPKVDYKNPYFFGLTASIHHAPSRLFFEIDYLTVNDRGSNNIKGQRYDFSFGYMF